MSRLIRLKELLELVPLSRSTVYDRMAAGTFPRSLNLGGGVVAWRLSDIEEWVASRPEAGPTHVG